MCNSVSVLDVMEISCKYVNEQVYELKKTVSDFDILMMILKIECKNACQ